MADHVEENNVRTIDKEVHRKAITHVKYVDEAEHELNIDNMFRWMIISRPGTIKMQ